MRVTRNERKNKSVALGSRIVRDVFFRVVFAMNYTFFYKLKKRFAISTH